LKWCRSSRLLVCSGLFGGAVLVALANAQLRAEMSDWLKYLEANSIQDAFFRNVAWPNGAVRVRRPPRETVPALTSLIAASPAKAGLYRLRAGEAELQLDFTAAEADWQKYAQTVTDSADGQLALAQFYHRRLRPADEMKALRAAAQASSAPAERLTPPAGQRSWRTFAQMLELIRAQQLPADLVDQTYRDWMARYPQEQEPYARYFDYLRDHRQFDDAGRQIAAYQKAFPDDRIYPFTARADLELHRGNAAQALALYEREFQPLWPSSLIESYLDMLDKAGRLRLYLGETRVVVQKNPEDLRSVAKLFYCLRKLGNQAAARRALVEFRLGKEARHQTWTADELATLALLFDQAQDPNESIRHYYALYSLPGAPAPAREQALAGIANVLLASPEGPIRFGSGDLSLYRDIGTMDPYPGYLNGILSLLLNSESPGTSLADQEQGATAYFHRARAVELVGLFDRQFPQSAERPALHARLIEAYAIYGESDGVIRHGRDFLTAFPSAPQRASVALTMADAYARKAQPREEFALYDALLKELAAKADGVPLGAAAAPPEGEEVGGQPARQPDTASGARSPEYARVLDRYISRLVSLDRVMDALAVCRGEIDRNPDDPGLYERLAAFLDQNKLGGQVEAVYRRAMERFPDASWTHKLARWYLRRQRRAEFEKLTVDVVKIFSGTDLEMYFQQLVHSSAIGAAAYRQVNLYAHQRFPNNLQFVRNLLDAYSRKETVDRRASRELLRQYWFYDDHLRQVFLSNYGDEEQREADALRTQAGDTTKLASGNPWGAKLVAEMAAWKSHFEEAAPVFDALAVQYPGDAAIALRAAAVDRSLAAYRPEFTAKAVALVQNIAKYEPASRATLTEAGEIYADRERFVQARRFWNRIPQIEPGNADGYLEAATVFWDYFQFDDALRLLAEGRRKLSDPALYAYQAGAIYENKRDYDRAIEEYVKGALATGGAGTEGASPARSRLLQLARRQALRPMIEARTAALVTGGNPDRPAVALRLAVLEQQNRRDDTGAFLLSLTRSASSPELLEDLSAAAARLGFENVREAVLERQIALASDDVERIRLRLALARYYESKPDVAAARTVIEDVLRANPAILGVVRAATDFYWRNHLPEQAVDTLAVAARSSNSVFKKQFTFEAAQKAAESGKYARARDLLTELLAGEPFNADYLAAMADTYARAGEYQQLRDFYTAKIADMSRAALPAAERNQRVAGLRRGLIPALEHLKDYAAAVDQYIEIINRYPEDEDLVKDAALFASRHGLQPRLAGYYTKASAESPKDVRLHVALARLQTQFEDYPAAVSAYDRAIAVRPDRLDLRIAQAQLEEKLTRFDQAIEAYRSLYTLSYHDPQWLLKVAELLARERRPAEAVKTVEAAMIEGRPAKPDLFFQAAATLENWGLLQEAATFAGRGVDLAGPRLLIDQGEGAELYARVMTRLRKHEEAYRRLYAAQQAGMRLPQREAVPQLADLALRQIGQTANTYFTPEEKVSLAALLEKVRATGGNTTSWNDSLLLLAQLAGLKEREVRWRSELLLAAPDAPAAHAHLSRIIELQKARMQFAELGSLLERYWRAKSDRPPGFGQQVLGQAAQAYATAGDAESEFRVLSQDEGGIDLERYLALLRTRDPDRRLKLAARSQAGVQLAIEAGDGAFARAVVSLGGSRSTPVWTRAYVSLVGLYYRDSATEVNQAFAGLLGGGTIGERLGKPVDRNQQLAGQTWFYFGSRYGEYLAATNRDASEDYLPAMLEAAPAQAPGYFALAQSYEELGNHGRAVAEYEDGLQFDANAGNARAAIADILWRQGKQEDATAQWRLALQAFRRQENSGRVPPEFWHDTERTLTAIGEHRILPGVRTQADQLLHDYIRMNGAYQVEPLLRGAMAAAASPEAGVSWILDLSRAARTPADSANFLSTIVSSAIPEEQKEPVLRRIVEVADAQMLQSAGEARTFAQSELNQRRIELLQYLAEHRRTDSARALLAVIQNPPAEVEIVIAAQSGELTARLDRYRQDRANAPTTEALQSAATQLRNQGDRASARAVLDYLYTRALDDRDLNPTNFLGLAEIRLEAGDVAAAMVLLRRMNLVSAGPFENLMAAADLLERTGHQSEAVEFLAVRERAAPWDEGARLRLAAIRHTTETLAAVATDAAAPYEMRVRAADALSPVRPVVQIGSGELDLLAAGSVDPTAAEKPLYFDARVRAAKAPKDPATGLRLLLGALAIDPEPQAVRVALVRAALDAGRDRTAEAAAEPILPRWWGRDEPSESERGRWAQTAAQQFLATEGLAKAERAAIAQRLADAVERSGDLATAAHLLRIAREIDPSPRLDARLAEVSAEIGRRRENMQRRPTVGLNVEQPAIVRPMLVAAKRGTL
jgi:cellulose synthase operon protein C